MTGTDKLMGFIPKDKYVKISYLLVIASCGLSLVLSILAMIGLFIPLGGIATLLGIAGLILSLLGLFVFKDQFSALDQNHLLYLAVLFAILFVTGLILGSAVAVNLFLVFAVSIILNAAQLLLFFTGYNSWSHGRMIGKDNIKSEIQLATKRA